MHGRETPPSSGVWRQTAGEGHGGGESQEREWRELGEEWKLGGRCWPREGVKTCKYQIQFLPRFQTLEPAV